MKKLELNKINKKFALFLSTSVVLFLVFLYLVFRITTSTSITPDLSKNVPNIPYKPSSKDAVYYGPNDEIEAYYDPEYFTPEEIKKLIEEERD